MKQSDDPKAFFEKYKFTRTMTKDHPEFKDTMTFEGLECDYVNSLERQIVELNKYIRMQNDRIDFMTHREFLNFKHYRDEKESPGEQR